MATSRNKSTWLIALDTHPNKRNINEFWDFTSFLSFHMVGLILFLFSTYYKTAKICIKKFILDKLIQSNTNSESDQQSDTSLVFRMKENRWIKPTQTASSLEMDDK